MSYRKSLQHMIGATIALILSGCAAHAIPTTTAPVIATKSPVQIETVDLSPTLTHTPISSFEDCVASDNLIQNTYPRQCINKNGQILTEALEKGVLYSKTFGEPAFYQIGRSIISTRDGGYLITQNIGCWALKVDALGNKQWESSFYQELNQEFQLANVRYVCRLARETPEGNYAIMGVAIDELDRVHKSFMLTLNSDGKWLSGQLIVEEAGKVPYLDSDGNLIRLTSLDIQPGAIAPIEGGYIIVGHYDQSSPPDSNMHIIKTDKNGTHSWDKNLCKDKNIHQEWERVIVCAYIYAFDVVQLQDGSFAITGDANGAWLIKTDSKGNIEWIQSYKGDLHSGYALLQTSDGGFLVAGEKNTDRKQNDGALIKTDSAGNLQWSRAFGGDRDDSFWAMEYGLHNEIAIVGSTEFPDGGTYVWLLGIDSEIFR